MEKITKKKKAKKGLKKRIGLFAIGGLSLVLTICLSVGATLAWFAGSTHADKSLFMGGPVYVEMAGRGTKDGENAATWQGGSGKLDITSFERGMGTVGSENGVLLPGQRFALYSQARVFSTSTTTSTGTNDTVNTSSGANVSNTSAGGVKHQTSKGRITTTTSSVLRARFSVSVEFDPTVGFNNFTGTDYAKNYPVQTGQYMGNNADGSGVDVNINAAEYAGLAWSEALDKEAYKASYSVGEGGSVTVTYPNNARRDAVKDATYTADTSTALAEIKAGTKKSIYSWKFVSESVYKAAYTAKPTTDPAFDPVTEAKTAGLDTTFKYVQMGAPFDGKTNAAGGPSNTAGGTGNGFYGVWVLTSNKAGDAKILKESDSFYKARCNSYIQSYVEQYPTEYGDFTERTIGEGLKALETALNQSFVNLVNDSSNAIIAGFLNGMTVNSNGIMSYATGLTTTGENPQWPGKTDTTPATNKPYASWLYIDPSIGNDTNTSELSTSTGGWWYLVECDNGTVGKYTINGTTPIETDINKINKVVDNYPTTKIESGEPGEGQYIIDAAGNSVRTNSPVPTAGAINRNDHDAKNGERLNAKLYEIDPTEVISEVTKNGTDTVNKVASYQFPFVNGSAVLAGDELTNIFANAKITVQISFQAVQAFFPFTTSIDGFTYKDTLLGTAKALNIANAIPIFNEAFDYYEATGSTIVSGL